MASLSMDIITAAIETAWANAKEKIDAYKANLPAEAVPAVETVENIIADTVANSLGGVKDAIVEQFKQQFLAGHGPVVKSGVDLA